MFDHIQAEEDILKWLLGPHIHLERQPQFIGAAKDIHVTQEDFLKQCNFWDLGLYACSQGFADDEIHHLGNIDPLWTACRANLAGSAEPRCFAVEDDIFHTQLGGAHDLVRCEIEVFDEWTAGSTLHTVIAEEDVLPSGLLNSPGEIRAELCLHKRLATPLSQCWRQAARQLPVWALIPRPRQWV